MDLVFHSHFIFSPLASFRTFVWSYLSIAPIAWGGVKEKKNTNDIILVFQKHLLWASKFVSEKIM